MTAKKGPPVIEESPAPEEDPVHGSLRQRIRQQALLAGLGVHALQRHDVAGLLDETARATADGMGTDLCKIMEYLPEEGRFLVRAGVGWDAGVVGHATVGADMASPAGFALKTGKPVISNHLENEERFRTPELLVEHGVRRAVNVILQGNGAPFGVLEVDSRSEGEFSEDDLAFLQGAANILGMAIERQRREADLAAAVERQKMLLQEMNHRIKNSLQIVASMLRLQAGSVDAPQLKAILNQAAIRTATVGRAYERLTYDGGGDSVDLSAYLRSVLADIDDLAENATVSFEPHDGIALRADRAILVGLIVNELVTNAAKYAYPVGVRGTITVRLLDSGNTAIVAVKDEGGGLPSDYGAGSKGSLGSRLVAALSEQLGAELTHTTGSTGTEFSLAIPFE